MAGFTFDELNSSYDSFRHPVAVITVGGKDISEDKAPLSISNIEVENTCGFEASIATFWIGNCFENGSFQFDTVKKYVTLGSSVVISLGYGSNAREVFRGFISRVNFSYLRGEVPGVEVTAMDVKGIMMSGSYAKQLKATSYSDAVSEILENTAYVKLQSNEIITKLEISDTPDKKSTTGGAGGLEGAAGGLGGAAGGIGGAGEKASDKTIEMVCESDYEFVVKAAKKFNYEFFTNAGTVYFRKAKDYKDILMEIEPNALLRSVEVSYDITGLAGKVEVRSTDVGNAKAISVSKNIDNKISQGSNAKQLIQNTKKVYIDPTVASKEDADNRADYLVEDISYRYGTLEAELIGLPELVPGRFIKLKDIGPTVSNTFYLVTVRHILNADGEYFTRITGKAAGLETEAGAGMAAGLGGGMEGINGFI